MDVKKTVVTIKIKKKKKKKNPYGKCCVRRGTIGTEQEEDTRGEKSR
jgi:hypothetical protein